MRKKKGFTLLELLAVIVVLAIIALIITPFVAKAIKESKKGAFKDSAYGIISATELYFAKHLKDDTLLNTTFTYTDYEEYNNVAYDSLVYKGEKPKNGIVSLNSNGKIELAISNGTYCAYKRITESEVTLIEGDCPSDLIQKYELTLELVSVDNTTATVTSTIELDETEYYFKLDDGVYSSNLDNGDNTYTFGDLTPGTTYTIIAKANTPSGSFLSSPLEVTTTGFTNNISLEDTTNTTIKVKSKISNGNANYYFKINSGSWVSNAEFTDVYEFTGLTKNTNYTITAKAVNDYGSYLSDSISVKTADLNTNVIQYKKSVYEECHTGANTCRGGYIDGGCSQAADWRTVYRSCAVSNGYKCYYYTIDCVATGSNSLCGEYVLRPIEGPRTYTGYLCWSGNRFTLSNSSCCATGSQWSSCASGSNTCQEAYIWDENWSTVKPGNTSSAYCKKRVCSVGSDGIINNSNCVDCASCDSADDATCVIALTPPTVDLQPRLGGGWSTYTTGSNRINIQAGDIYVHGETNSRQTIYAYKDFDVTDYNTLTISYATNGYTGVGDWVVRVYVGGTEVYTHVVASRSTIHQTKTINISGFSGVQRIKLGGTAQPEGGDVSFTRAILSK